MSHKWREAKLIMVAGRKGVGKTFQTLCQIADYLRSTTTKQGRKVLIFDVNNEFGNVREDHGNAKFPNIGLIKLSQVPAYAKITRPFAKRVSIFKDDGQKNDAFRNGTGFRVHIRTLPKWAVANRRH